MLLTREHAREVVDTYITAWESQDPELILTVFTEDATYYERIFEEPIRGHEGIRRYWVEKVGTAQARIDCTLLALYVDGNAAVAEWDVSFDDLDQGVRKQMIEVAILEFRDGLIAHLREYWSSRQIEALEAGPPAE